MVSFVFSSLRIVLVSGALAALCVLAAGPATAEQEFVGGSRDQEVQISTGDRLVIGGSARIDTRGNVGDDGVADADPGLGLTRIDVRKGAIVRGFQDGIDVEDGKARIRNWGFVSGFEDDGIEFDGGWLWNWGTILAEGHAGSSGDAIDADGPAKIWNWGTVISVGEDGIDFDSSQNRDAFNFLYNAGWIESRGANDAGVEVDFTDNNDDPDFFKLVNYSYGRILSRDGVGLDLQSSDPDTRAVVINKGLIQGFNFGIRVEDSDTRLALKNNGIVRGLEGPALGFTNPGDNTLRLKGLGTFDGAVEGSDGENDTLILDGLFVPLEVKRQLEAGERPTDLGPRLGWVLGWENYELGPRGVISLEEWSKDELDDFGRVLDYSAPQRLGVTTKFLGGLTKLDQEEFNDVGRTATGLVFDEWFVDYKYWNNTARNFSFQRMFDQQLLRDFAAVEAGQERQQRFRGRAIAHSFFGDQDETSHRSDNDWTSVGGSLAGDVPILGDGSRMGTMVGGFVSMGETNADVDGFGSEAEVEDYGLGVYGSMLKPLGFGDGLYYQGAGAGWGGFSRANDAKRVFMVDGLYSRSTTDVDIWDYGFWWNNSLVQTFGPANQYYVAPFAGLQWEHVDIHKHTFEGAGELDLTTREHDGQSLTANYGIRAGSLCSHDWGTIDVHGHATGQHEFLRRNADVNKEFASPWIDNFDVDEREYDRNWVTLGLGMGLTFDRWSDVKFNVDFDSVLGKDDFQGYQVQAGFKYSF